MVEKNTKTVYKLKWKKLGKLLCILVFIILFIIGSWWMFNFFKDKNNLNKIISEIQESIKVENIVDDEKTKTIAPDSTLSKFDIYWDYIKLSLIDVDMASLKKINSDSIGYIEVKGTDFNYPIVEYNDGYYKNHSFDKSENSNGWVYLDKDSNYEILESNTVIKGNKNIGNSLFANLNVMFKDSWNQNDDNFIIKYYTNNYSTLWQIISVFKTSEKNIIKTEFTSDEEIETFANEMISRSELKFKSNARASDKFLTLTTNSNGSNIVVFAKLLKIKEENPN